MTSKALVVTTLILLSLSFRVNAQIIPPAPTGLAVTAESDNEILLEWEDNSKNEDFFIIERSVNNESAFEIIAIIESNSDSFSDLFVGPKTTYYYRVKARNSTFFGNFDSEYSNTDSATTPGPPDTPANLAASTLSKTSIEVTWKEGSDDTEQYEIERSIDNSGNFTPIQSVSSNQKSYVDNNLNSNTRYFYRVRANNEYGDSDFSNDDFDITHQFPPTVNAIADPAPILEGAGIQVINVAGISAGGSESQFLDVKAVSDNKALIPDPTVSYTSPNANATLSFKPVSGASGEATITVTIVDDGPNNPPSNINKTSTTFSVTVDKALPDFVVQKQTAPDLICLGQPFQVQCDVKNRGFVKAPESELSIYFSAQDKKIDGSDILLKTQTVPELDKNQVETIIVDVSLNQVSDLGPYYIIFKMDHSNEVAELKENNNAKNTEVSLCLPDLSIQNHSLDQPLLSKGQPFSVSFDLVNLGDVGASNHQVKYYLTQNASAFTEEESIGATSVSSIGVAETRSFDVNLSIPSSTEEGNYFLVIKADGENEILEKDENNNVQVADVTIENLPDLNIATSDINPSLVAFGQTVLINTTIVNDGVEPAGANFMKFYLSSDSLISQSDLVFETEAEIPELAVAEKLDLENLLEIPEEFEEGNYYVIARVDDGRIIKENNEQNNVVAHELLILSDIPPVIQDTAFPEYRVEGLDNTIIKIKAEDDVEITKVNFNYKGIRSTMWDSTSVNLEGDFYQVSIPGAIFDELGLEYYFEVFDDVGLKAVSDTGFTYIEYQNNGLPFDDLSFGKDETAYRMISIPLDLSQKDINAIFEDDLGPYDKTKWRLLTYDNGEYIEYQEGLSEIEIGRGYWLIIRDQMELDTGEGRTVKANQTELYEITLTKGWNQIGNPYNFDFKWSDVLSANGFPSGISGDIKIFDGGFKSTDILESFQGGFVQANTNITLKIPIAKEEVITAGRKAGGRKDISREWYVSLAVGNGLLKHEINGFGMNENALEGIDPFDETTLPDFGFLSSLAVKFNNKYLTDQQIAKDIVPLKNQHVWSLEIENESVEQYVYLSWDISDLAESDENLVLYNPKNGLQVNMHLQSGIWIDNGDADELKIIYGDDDFIKNSLHTSSVVLGGGYPNPFHTATKIPLVLPKSAIPYEVYLQVYNSLGQNVKTLMKGNYEAGLYEIEWDGLSDAGNKVKPGIYFYQLKVENDYQHQSFSGRLVFE